MIKGNTFVFGYGDIAVGSDIGGIGFCEIKPPQECGSNISKDAEYIGEDHYINCNFSEANNLKNMLLRVKSGEMFVFNFKEYVFDFSNYNIESVNVCLKHINSVIVPYQIALAC